MDLVLVIDDEAATRRMIQRILEAGGYEVIEAENGRTGLQAFRVQNPTVIITDILMPEKEGIETIREMRATRPDARIIAISGGSKKSALGPGLLTNLAMSLGADALLAKPFRKDELLNAVNRLAGASKAP